jgi:hypothetical protein
MILAAIVVVYVAILVLALALCRMAAFSDRDIEQALNDPDPRVPDTVVRYTGHWGGTR